MSLPDQQATVPAAEELHASATAPPPAQQVRGSNSASTHDSPSAVAGQRAAESGATPPLARHVTACTPAAPTRSKSGMTITGPATAEPASATPPLAPRVTPAAPAVPPPASRLSASDNLTALTDLAPPEFQRAPVVESLWAALRDVEDPEIPVSLVDMGLIVSIDYRATDRTARLQITYTAMGCPAMDMIQEDIRARLLREADVENVEIEVVWDPVWTHRRLSPAARASMRELGIAV